MESQPPAQAAAPEALRADAAPGRKVEQGRFADALSHLMCCVRPAVCRPWCGEQFEDELRIAGGFFRRSTKRKGRTALALEDPAALLCEGIICCLMHRDGGSVRCVVKLNRSRTSLILKAGEKGRTVPLEQIHGVLYGDELKRIDAFDADNTPCVAIYMVSGSAIPMVFPSEELKRAFLDGMGALRIGPDARSSAEKKAIEG